MIEINLSVVLHYCFPGFIFVVILYLLYIEFTSFKIKFSENCQTYLNVLILLILGELIYPSESHYLNKVINQYGNGKFPNDGVSLTAVTLTGLSLT